MKKNLTEITQKWMRLERKTLEQRRKADEFYENKLMALIEEDFWNGTVKRFMRKRNILSYL